MFSVFLGILLLLLFFVGQSAVVLVALHQGVNEAFRQIAGPPDVQWQFRKAIYLAALAFCLLIMVSEIAFYLFSK